MKKSQFLKIRKTLFEIGDKLADDILIIKLAKINDVNFTYIENTQADLQTLIRKLELLHQYYAKKKIRF